MKKRLLIPIIAIGCLLASVGVGRIFGWWQVTAEPLSITDSSDVANIKGSSSLQDVSTAYGIPLDTLYQLLGLPADTAGSTQLKELEEIIEVSEVRTRVDAYLHPDTAPTAAPEEAATKVPSATVEPSPAATAHTEAQPACDIKGSLSLEQVSIDCAVPLDYLYSELGLPADLSAATLLKDVSATVSGFEISTVKSVVAEYQAQ